MNIFENWGKVRFRCKMWSGQKFLIELLLIVLTNHNVYPERNEQHSDKCDRRFCRLC